MQRNLIIIAAVIVLLGLGVVAYLIYFKNAPSITVAPTASSNLPIAGQGVPPSTSQTTTSFSPTGTPVTAPARLVEISTGPVVPGEAVVDIKAANASSSVDVSVN